ncbi:MAG: hypothetical protein ACK4SZ_06775 [Allosphingosinicella sp.]|uniref:hypothetical protein n=1 Tax=Allosphingosinicella sp. TaxID=2823234 RepID=UPI003953F1AC
MASNDQRVSLPPSSPIRAPGNTSLLSNSKQGLQSTVFITFTVKGGAGKTEVADSLEPAITLGGATCRFIDVDDGNRGMARRVGKENVTTLDWSTSVTGAAQWVARHAPHADTMIFDLGAGIESSDLPVMAFLGSVWRLLADGGARIVICAVVSTNAPTSTFIERIARKYGDLGEVVIVCNNQDGSHEFPAEVATLPHRKLHLGNLYAGVQAVRLSRRQPLSSVISNPSQGFELASAVMARRIFDFARQPGMKDFVRPQALDRLAELSERAPKRLRFVIGTRSDATDSTIELNARLAQADAALLSPNIDDAEILARAIQYRRAYEAFATRAR